MSIINGYKGSPKHNNDVVTGWTNGVISVGWHDVDTVVITDQYGHKIYIDGGDFEGLLSSIAQIRQSA